ncbi:MAG: O-antigen ligase family protein [Acutalibacteraceae bacterium]|nr:O-antigen ligase family protein [Acutalibacteraceae bacterium]
MTAFSWSSFDIVRFFLFFFYFFTFISLVLFFLNCISKNTEINSLVFSAFVLYILSILSTIANFYSQRNFFGSLLNQSFWFASFVFFFFLTKNFNSNKLPQLYRILLFFLFLFCTTYIIWVLSNPTNPLPISINAIYYPIFLFPLFFLIKNPIAKSVLALLVFFATFLSNKRTAVLALILAVFIPFIFSAFLKKHDNRKRSVISLFLLCIALIIAYNIVYENFDIDVWARFKSIEEDRGSNRFDIYAKVFSEIKELNFFDALLGKGFNGVFLASSLSTSAHNDFLEVFYDFGIMGFICYIIFIVKIVSFNIPLFRSNSPFALSYLSSTIIFLVFSVTSHVILYPTYFFYILFFWSIAISDYEKQININSEVKTIENRNCNLS